MVLVQPYRQGDLGLMLSQAIGVVIVGIIGLVVSILTRNRNNADTISIVGYAAPAVLVCAYGLFVALI